MIIFSCYRLGALDIEYKDGKEPNSKETGIYDVYMKLPDEVESCEQCILQVHAVIFYRVFSN